MARTRVAEALYRAGLFTLPFALAFVYLLVLLAVLSPGAPTYVYGGMATYLLAPVGTEIVIPLVVIGLRGLNPPAAFPDYVLGVASIVLVDVFTALFIAWNWDLLERIPRLGALLRRVEAKCRDVIARRRWGEGATLTALAAYVALPVQMTGGLFGSVLGRVMGLSKTRVFLAIVAGSAAGAVPMGIVAYVAAEAVLEAFQSPTAQTIAAAAGILITIAFVAAIVLLYRRGRGSADSG